MKTIGIITAMDIEFDEIAKLLSNHTDKQTHLSRVLECKLNDNLVVLVESGIGKVSASMATQWLIDTYQPDEIYNVGIAGGISEEVDINTLVVGRQFVQHDMVAAPWLGRPQGEVPLIGSERSYPISDASIAERIATATKANGMKVASGNILSGDELVFDEVRREHLVETFSSFNPLAVDMESASFAFVCAENKVPFGVVRAISDKASDDEKPISVDTNEAMNSAAKVAAKVIIDTIS